MRRALLIGIQQYGAGYSTAIGPAVARDLSSFERLMTELGVAVSKRLGADGQTVGYADIKRAVAELLTQALPDDDVFVYFSGHGRYHGGVTYLVPSEADPRLPEPESYLVPVRFDAEIRATKARSVTVLIDACRNGDPDVVQHLAPIEGPATSFLFAARPTEVARTLPGSSAASVFTRALIDIVPSLPTDIRLDRARRLLQERVDALCAAHGFDPQIMDVVANLDEAVSPFPLFAQAPVVTAKDRWSRQLRSSRVAPLFAVGDDLPVVARQGPPQDLLVLMDRLEHDAPDLDGGPTATPWAEPTLIERLTRAMEHLVLPGLSTEFEQRALIGLVGAVEAGIRQAEAEMIAEEREPQSMMAIMAAEPALRRRIQQQSTTLRLWVVHLAAVRECILGRAGDLRSKVSEVIREIAPGLDVPAHKRATEYLLACARTAFDSASSMDEIGKPLELDPFQRELLLDGRSISAVLQLVWWLSLDSRLFPPESGIHLVDDTVAVTEALGSLHHAKWTPLGNLLDLYLFTRSAALDRALREHSRAITDLLLLHTQPGAPLEGTTIPRAAATSRLRADEDEYSLPHVTFEVSASETQALLMGTNLYGDASLAIRELYQNAVDACHYRERRIRHVSGGGLAGWMPSITFRVGADKDGPYIDCIDNGVGMSDHELREAFAKVGRRFRDLPEFLEERAEWTESGEPDFQPISQFGIGVLSYFMIAENLELWTTRTDRRLRLGTPLHVRVHSGGGLFQVKAEENVVPPNGGTLVRLRLRPDMKGFDTRKALQAVVRAPTIPVTFQDLTDGTRDQTWVAGRLYDEFGAGVEPCLARPEHRVFFHRGPGEILVNGIPADDDSGSGLVPAGCTMSLDGRAHPELSIDRRRLLSYNEEYVRQHLRSAAHEVGGWSDATVNWLLELFDTDLEAAIAAYNELAGSSLVLCGELPPERPATDPPDPRPEQPGSLPEVRIVPGEDGIFPDDPTILGTGTATSVLGQARVPALTGRRRPGRPSDRPTGLPLFDHRLASLLATPWAYGYAKYNESDKARYSRSGYARYTIERWDANYDESRRRLGEKIRYRSRRINSVGGLRRLAEGLGVTLGSVAAYAWAVAAIDDPQPLWLPRTAAWLTPRRDRHLWEVIGSHPLRDTIVLTRAMRVRRRDAVEAAFSGNAEAAMLALDRLSDQRSDVRIESGMLPFDRLFPTSDTVPDGLSREALVAVSKYRDRDRPYFRHTVPALNVAFALYEHRQERPTPARTPEAVVAELTEAGFRLLPSAPRWDQLLEAIEIWPGIATTNTTDDNGLIEFVESLDELGEIVELVSADVLQQCMAALALGGVGTKTTKALSEVSLPSTAMFRRHAKTLTANFHHMDLGVYELVAIADVDGTTYGEAIGELRRYASVARSWNLSRTPPERLALQRPTAVIREYFLEQDDAWRSAKPVAAQWALRATRQSAIQGHSMAEIADQVTPLLALEGHDASALERVAAIITRQIAFDDLLVLATQQFTPPLDDAKEIVAACTPFAVDASSLGERAEAWLLAGPLRMNDCWPPD